MRYYLQWLHTNNLERIKTIISIFSLVRTIFVFIANSPRDTYIYVRAVRVPFVRTFCVLSSMQNIRPTPSITRRKKCVNNIAILRGQI